MSESEWAALIEECQTSGIGIKLWCKNHGIAYSRYRYWVKKLESKQKQWVQVPVAAPSSRSMNNKINLNCGKWTVIVGNDTSIELLGDVLRVVDEICC